MSEGESTRPTSLYPIDRGEDARLTQLDRGGRLDYDPPRRRANCQVIDPNVVYMNGKPVVNQLFEANTRIGEKVENLDLLSGRVRHLENIVATLTGPNANKEIKAEIKDLKKETLDLQAVIDNNFNYLIKKINLVDSISSGPREAYSAEFNDSRRDKFDPLNPMFPKDRTKCYPC